MQRKNELDVVVVGAGPAGLMAAIAAARQGACVALLEQLEKPGAKLRISGGGRCNLTNTLPNDAFMTAFGKQGRFMQNALAEMDSIGLRNFFAENGVPTFVERGCFVFPQSQSSTSVLNALWSLCAHLHVERQIGVCVNELIIRDRELAGIRTRSGDIPVAKVIMATGGKSYPELGATGAGYELARQAGHIITPLLPVLVPLYTRETWPKHCTGIGLEDVRVWIDLPRHDKSGCRGDLLMTHRGVTGPVILNLSRDAVPLLQKTRELTIRIEFKPEFEKSKWIRLFDAWQNEQGTKKIVKLLDGVFPHSLAEVLIQHAGIPTDQRAARFSRPQRMALLDALTGLPLTVTGSGGYEVAMVTRGGVSLNEVDPRTLESKRVQGLYFAGEILDLDGPTGGFNLQWAFSSGWLAGMKAGMSSQ